jgi:hypothetical protein
MEERLKAEGKTGRREKVSRGGAEIAERDNLLDLKDRKIGLFCERVIFPDDLIFSSSAISAPPSELYSACNSKPHTINMQSP